MTGARRPASISSRVSVVSFAVKLFGVWLTTRLSAAAYTK